MKKLFSLSILILLITPLAMAQNGNNLELLYNWSDSTIVGSAAYNNVYNEIWGFTINNREFAVIGSTSGTHIFDVTDPVNSSQVQFIAGADVGPAIIHRDYHDRNGYLYAVSDEGNSTLQIINLKQLPDTAIVVYDSNELIRTSHNIFIDESLNKLYACGVRKGDTWGSSTSLAIYDIENPTNPIHLTNYEVPGTGYNVHDMWVKNDTAFLNNGGNGLFVVDFTNHSDPQIIGSLTEYPDKGYNHSGWPTSDMKTYVMADEDWGYDLKVLDISNLSDINVTATFSSEINENSIAHNQLIKDNHVYVSSYHDGLQVYDISNQENPIKVASYSTYLMNDHNSYRGAWGVYPFLPSGNILVSDMQYGLYVLAPSINFGTTEFSNNELSIYPNPVSKNINIQLPIGSEISQLYVYDLKGKIVFQNKISELNNSINIETLKSGMYFVKVEFKNKLYHQKFIVQ